MNKIYIASYDLSEPNRDYEGVGGALASCGEVKRVQQSVWLIATSSTAVEIRDAVKPFLEGEDSFFVTQLDIQDWAGWRTRAQAWISEHAG